jgi:hypothetical protein
VSDLTQIRPVPPSPKRLHEAIVERIEAMRDYLALEVHGGLTVEQTFRLKALEAAIMQIVDQIPGEYDGLGITVGEDGVLRYG